MLLSYFLSSVYNFLLVLFEEIAYPICKCCRFSNWSGKGVKWRTFQSDIILPMYFVVKCKLVCQDILSWFRCSITTSHLSLQVGATATLRSNVCALSELYDSYVLVSTSRWGAARTNLLGMKKKKTKKKKHTSQSKRELWVRKVLSCLFPSYVSFSKNLYILYAWSSFDLKAQQVCFLIEMYSRNWNSASRESNLSLVSVKTWLLRAGTQYFMLASLDSIPWHN